MTTPTHPRDRKKRWALIGIVAGGLGLLLIAGTIARMAFRKSEPGEETRPGLSLTLTINASTTGPPNSASLGDAWIRPADEMTMVYVPPGTFEMGSKDIDLVYALQKCEPYGAECGSDWFSNELPAHLVTLNGFWIDQTEVTNAHYQRCLEAGACGEAFCVDDQASAAPDHPVTCVAWDQAQTYCEWASARLPTEAEWEYAARGTTSSAFPWGNTFDSTHLNYCDTNCEFPWADASADDGYARTAPAGTFSGGKSWCGALDMAGNVHEWVADWYADDYYAHSADLNPTGPSLGDHRILRGGSWGAVPGCARTASRGWTSGEMTASTFGFRCARSPE